MVASENEGDTVLPTVLFKPGDLNENHRNKRAKLKTPRATTAPLILETGCRKEFTPLPTKKSFVPTLR